uniref:Zinc finger protein 831 n=1 Tax=Castor canadensis TaxID=51338 RepID=A0A8B7WGL6_CASCN|nr:zinc finger protein 831 [Castor canadensis]
MEAPEPTCPGPSTRDKPALAPGLSGTPRGQASPHLTLGPVILPQEQNLPPTVFLKALPIPLYHTVPPGGLQPRAPLVTGSLDGGSVPFILSPLLQPEGPGPTQVGKPAAPTLTVNIVGALPVLSPGLAPTLGSPGKVRNAGKYLCPHCGRDCLKPSVLEKHIRSHTGERPFPCATCGIAFKTQSNLYKHRRTQTHLNNSRLSLESERGRHSLLDEGDRVREPSTADGTGENQNQGTPETALSPGPHLSLAAKNLEMKTEATPNPDSTLVHREGPVDSTQIASPLASSQPRRKLPEQKPCSLPRQQGMTLEKPWDSRASEGRLRKCESTDSGYLSRSDSAEQPPVPSSPLHSLSEHSVESEGEGGPGPGLGGARAESGAPGASLELEKKQLEERIARLISHNQAVVDDPQLDHVRPRKTVLSKQGSIDLPMPYTYKDSFHFDIRALEPGRRRAALCPARSTFTPLDKARPLFFHSVPTQLSTTVECVPVTRSNSLPFVEGSRTWPEPRDLQDACPRLQKPLSPRLAPTRVGYHSGLTLADVPSGHPRALVRQAAVEDVPCVPTGDTSAPAEDLDGKKTPAGDGAASKSRVASKKTNQRKLKMFSQEKWQVYGNETFERIYQKMKSRHQGGQKARKVRAGHETELNLPHQEEVAGGKGVTLSQESKTLILGDISVEDKPWRSLPAPEDSLETESPQQKKTVAGTGDTDQLRVARPESSPTLSSRVPHHLGSRSPQFPPKGRMEPGCQLPPSPRPLQREDLGDSRLILTDPKLERGLPSGGSVKETCPWAQPVLRRPSGGSGEPQSLEDKLPSERKKLKVEGLDPQEQLRLLGTETAGGSVQAASLPSQKQDGDPQEMPGGPPEDALPVAAPLESSCTSPATAAVLKQEGPRDKEPRLPPAARAPGHHVQLATQPQPPSDLTAVADSTFPPKYLLRLPQGETPPQLPISRGQGQDSLCTSGQPEQRRVSLVGSEPGTSQSLSPASGPTSGETDRILDPSWSRPSDGREEAQAGKEKAQVSVPATKDSPGSATGVPQETASFLSVCNAHVVRDPGDATHAIHDLCTDRILTRARTSGDLLNPWSPTWELGQPLESALEVPSMEPLAGLNVSCPFQPGSFLPAPMGPQGMALGRTELAPARHLGTPRSCRAQSSFPSLRAEPRLTWCCLSRSLPLPVEQKDKTASVYSALHFPGDSLQDEGPSILPFSSGGRTRTSPGGGGPVQTPELSYPTVPGMRAQDPVLDPERKKGLCRRRVKTSRGDSRQKKLRLHPKR